MMVPEDRIRLSIKHLPYVFIIEIVKYFINMIEYKKHIIDILNNFSFRYIQLFMEPINTNLNQHLIIFFETCMIV